MGLPDARWDSLTIHFYPTTSNKLSSITQTGATTRSFAYDASGDRTSDTVGASVLNELYDGHGHLMTFKNGSTTDGTYGYDGFSRLVQRVVSNVSPAGRRGEYVWLDDMPVAIIDQVNTANPVLYYVHADHLNRPIMVTNSAGASVWNAIWTPFGAPYSITGALTYNARFPGQWFQIESGLNWNWHRQYDPSTGRYIQPDPLGLTALLSDGPSVYGYAKQASLGWVDRMGLQEDVPDSEPIPELDPRDEVDSEPTYERIEKEQLRLKDLADRACLAFEQAGGGRPNYTPTPKGAPQFIFPNGLRLRFDLYPGQFLQQYGQTPHINIDNGPPGIQPHIDLK
jgi:RHS repeat-associated protein